MRRVNQNEQALLQLGDGCHGEDELGRLCRYFYEHIATLIHQLNKRANYDDLTSLLSRQRLIGDIQRRDKFNLAILDIDRFKEINNLLGIEAGDELLKATSVSLVAFFTRDGYALYRLNADEFAVLDGAGEEQAAFEKRIREFVEDYGRKELTVKNEPISVAISSGLSDSREPMPMMAATTALKYAKEKKAKVAIYRRDLPILKEYECNLRVAKVIRHAIEEDLVVPFFQPIKDVGNGSVYKYEALMRIRDRSGVIHAPLEFLEISKKSGSYGDLSHRLIKKSVALFRDRKEILAINLSILDIEDDGFLGFLRKLRDTYGIMDRLIFEITEQERV
nr:EAL domain-containing protein [Thiocystis violacea]